MGEAMVTEPARKRLRPVACLVLALLISGCANSLTGASFNTTDPTDACRAQRQDLSAFQDYFTRAMFEGAAIGALSGGLMGGLIGGDVKGALIGAGAGAVVGGTVGYYSAKQRANSGDQAALTQSVYQDISTENTQIDGVAGAFNRLRDCRFRNAQSVKADYAAGRLTQAEAQNQLIVIRTRFQQDIAFAESLGARMATRGQEYQNASNELVKLDPAAQQQAAAQQSQPAPASQAAPAQAARPAPQRRAQPQPQAASAPPAPNASGVAQLTETNQLKRKALADDLESAKVAANTQFELDGKISERQAGTRAA
jgi:hypothetical protein